MLRHATRVFSTSANRTKGSSTGIAGVDFVVAVSSAKGGVGKSTVAVNLAISLASFSSELKIGLLDADVYGPSIPRMMNLKGQPGLTEDKLLIPMENYGVKCMSMGFLMEDSSAATWRGPMVMSAIRTFIQQVAWAPLDILLVDMPPGTGDAQISISQQLALSGAIIVSTPQDIALLDAQRGVVMWRKVNVPILGMVENMSYFACPKCNHQEYIFGQEGAVRLAQDLGIDLLGQVPLETVVRESCDRGSPVAASNPEHRAALAYTDIARKVLQKLKDGTFQRPPAPDIIIGD